MIEQLHHRGWHYVVLIAIGTILFFVNLGGATLWDMDEGKNVTCAWEMMSSNNWIVPTFNAKLRVDKPVLLYWLQILSYHSFGVNEFSGRFPSAVAALLTVLLSYELARAMFSRTTGLLAGVIVATSPMLCGAARFANPDALLNACTVLAITLFWLGRQERRWWWFALIGAASGLAVLAKGLVGLILPDAVVVLFLLWERHWRIFWDRRWFITIWAFALTALPWYVWVSADTHGEFLRGFLWKHHFQRGLSAMEEHHGFPGFYLVILLVGTAPWSIFLVGSWWFGLWSAVRQPWRRWQGWWSYAAEDVTGALAAPTAGELRDDAPAAYRLLICWIFIYGLFFSIAATKLPNYILPIVVPCGILTARFLQRWQTGLLKLPEWFVQCALIGLFALGAAASMGIALASGLIAWPVVQGRVLPGLQPCVLIGLVPLLAAMLGWRFVRQRRYRRFVTSVAICALLMLGPLATYGSMIFNQHKAPRALVEQVEGLQQSEDLRIGCWDMVHLPSLNFYAKRNVIHFDHEPELVSFLKYPIPVYLFMPAQKWEQICSEVESSVRIVARHEDMYRQADIVVVTNR